MYPGHGTADQVIFARGFELIPRHVFVCICIESNSKMRPFQPEIPDWCIDEVEYAKHVRSMYYITMRLVKFSFIRCWKMFSETSNFLTLKWHCWLEIHVHVKQVIPYKLPGSRPVALKDDGILSELLPHVRVDHIILPPSHESFAQAIRRGFRICINSFTWSVVKTARYLLYILRYFCSSWRLVRWFLHSWTTEM